MLRKISGYASLLPKQHLVALDNVSSGFDLWDLDVGMHLCTFPTGPPTHFLPRQVVFVERWKAIVAGSDHGAVYVFDRTTGAPLDVLRHPAKGLVQTVAVSKYQASTRQDTNVKDRQWIGTDTP